MIRLFFSLVMTLAFALCAVPAVAQAHDHAGHADHDDHTPTVRLIDLETVLTYAGADNLDVRAARQQLQAASANAEMQKKWWLPTIYGGIQGHALTGSAMNEDGRFFTNVNQSNFWTGLGLDAEWNFAEGPAAAKLAAGQMQLLQYQSDAEKLHVLRTAVRTYYALAGEQARYMALQTILAQADTIVGQIATQVEADRRSTSALLLARSNLKHTELMLIQCREGMDKHSARLVELLNIPENVRLISADSMLIPVEMVTDAALFTQETYAYTRRPEFKRLQAGLSVLELARQEYSKELLRPTLRLNVANGGLGRPFWFFANQFQVNAGLMWRFPLERVFYNREAEVLDLEMRVQTTRMEVIRNRITREVRSASAQVRSAEAQMTIARESMELAQQALSERVAQQRRGTAKAFELFQALEYMHRTQMDWIHATKSYNQAQWELWFALGNTERK